MDAPGGQRERDAGFTSGVRACLTLGRVAGSPGATCGPIAQWSEQGTHNPLVLGSNPSGPTNKPKFRS